MARMSPDACGVDEAGRGPIAGPVFAAAVVLGRGTRVAGLDDSKKLSAARRDELAIAIRERAAAWAIASATVDEIDRLNILHATLLAMQRAIEALAVTPTEVWVDGLQVPRVAIPARAVVRGDASVKAISAASILAKTARDAEMARLAERFPQYGFERHKGYPTREHLDALARHGPCEAYRRTFAPVRAVIEHGFGAQPALFWAARPAAR
jgi:ribonuclease HII